MLNESLNIPVTVNSAPPAALSRIFGAAKRRTILDVGNFLNSRWEMHDAAAPVSTSAYNDLLKDVAILMKGRFILLIINSLIT